MVFCFLCFSYFRTLPLFMCSSLNLLSLIPFFVKFLVSGSLTSRQMYMWQWKLNVIYWYHNLFWNIFSSVLTVFAIDALSKIAVLHTTCIMVLYLVVLVVSEGRNLALLYDCWVACFVLSFHSISINSYWKTAEPKAFCKTEAFYFKETITQVFHWRMV